MPTPQNRQRRARSSTPTLADVAALANVSTATVSRCLNAPDSVVKSTRDRVMSAVHKLGYAPNFGAQALAAQRTNTFGAVIPTIENAIFARALQAFQDELGHHEITLISASSSYDPALEAKQIRTLVARGADAMLLVGQERSPEIYKFLAQRDIPFVVAWVYDSGADFPTVGFNNRKAMRALVRKVLDKGHRSLGFITAPRTGNDRALGRYLGVRDAMAERGLDPETLKVEETTYSIENGAAAFEAMMADARPTAVLCGNDVLAAGAMMKAAQLGIRVPDDVSITGFDDIEIAHVLSPGLTTVHVPHREMGRRSAQVLLAMRNGSKTVDSIELSPKIKWRASLAEAPVGR